MSPTVMRSGVRGLAAPSAELVSFSGDRNFFGMKPLAAAMEMSYVGECLKHSLYSEQRI